jgi:hypothetical protein
LISLQRWQSLLAGRLILLLNIVNFEMLNSINLTQMEPRICLECGLQLSGRKDQKYCSDYCRNTCNNRQNESSTAYVRRINNILRKNRRILSILNPKGKVTIDGMTLAEEGFNFHYFTNIYKTQKGTQYYFCYDEGYIKTVNDQYMLVKKQDYVK